jgi:hypothetical protein
MKYGRKKINVRKGKKVGVLYKVKQKEERRAENGDWMAKR